ncbi:hypothetical protein B296_00003644 [Ensete ventricosum]|uniref:Uncharacterized protein n=1 Tax=Ensete ventricosum TaxID=4639 RepID=A0A427A2N9_ENSVE|nr:hypothetical protein B296_00003644 [Ensete ventricosum]
MSRDHSSGDSRAASLSYNTSTNGLPYSGGRHHIGDQRTAAARAGHQVGHSQHYDPRHDLDDGRGQWYASTTSTQYYERSLPSQYERDHYSSRSYYDPHNGSSHPDARGRVPAYNYPPGGGGYPYPSVNPPVPQLGSYAAHTQASYPANYGGYHAYGTQQWEQYGDERAPPPTQHTTGRSYGHHQQPTNRYTALDRSSNRRLPPPPPPPGFGRQ